MADWRFLLPELDVDSVLFVGAPPGPVLELFARTARCVVLVSAAERDPRRARRRGARPPDARTEAHPGTRADVHREPRAGVHTVLGPAVPSLPFRPHAFSLVVAPRGPEASALLRSADLAGELGRLLAPGGVAYIEGSGAGQANRALGRIAPRRHAGGAPGRPRGGRGQAFWRVRRGEGLSALVPCEDRAIARYFSRHVLRAGTRGAEALAQIGRSPVAPGMLPSPLLDRLFPRLDAALLWCADPNGAPVRSGPSGPMEYMTRMGDRAGIDLTHHTVTLSSANELDPNNIVAYLFPEGAAEPDILVKMVRAPEYNGRLERDYRARRLLRDRGFAAPGTYPEALFLDRSGGLAALGERVVHGVPLRRTLGDGRGHVLARDAVEWFTRLGESSAAEERASPARIQARLRGLLDRAVRVYRLEGHEAAWLDERFARLGAVRGDIPLVFQHGDPYLGNVLVDRSGRPVFIDWDRGGPGGLPLWDLFYFLRDLGAAVGELEGEPDAVAAYADRFVEASPWSVLQAEATEEYCARVGVDRGAAEPLFYGLLLRHALREALSLPPGWNRLFMRLVRLCMRRADAPGLRMAFG